MSRRGGTALWLGVLAGLVLLAPPARAEGRRRMLVLGPDGRRLERVVAARAKARIRDRPVVDAAGEGVEIPLPDGVLVPGREVAGTGDLVLWAPGLAATAPGESDTGVRLLAARALSGRVRFPDGRPAATRPVLAVPERPGGVVHRATTDEEGRYALPNLAPGRWEIAVLRAGDRWQTLGTFVAGEASPQALVIEAGGVSGLVLDGDAPRTVGLGGVDLLFVALPGGAAPAGSTIPARTDEEGAFHVADVPPGIWEVAVPADSPYHVRRPPPRVEITASVASEMHNFSLLRRQSVAGTVVDPDGKPIEGAWLRLLPAAGQDLPPDIGPAPSVTSGADGAFRFERMRPDVAYRLAAAARGHAPVVLPAFEIPRSPVVLAPVTLTSSWVLEVRVWGEGAVRLEGVPVDAVPATSPEPFRRAFGPLRATTDADGVARFADLPLDDVRVTAGGGAWRSAEDEARWPRTAGVVVVNLRVDPAPTLAGRVVSDGEAALPAVEIHAVPANGSPPVTASVDADGAFVVEGIPAVPTDLQVMRRGAGDLLPLAVYEDAMPGTGESPVILVPPLARLSGVADGIAPDGPAAEVRLEAPLLDPSDRDDHWRQVARVGVGGTSLPAAWSFEGLPPGPYAVRLVQGHVDSGPVPVWIEEGDVGGIELVLPAGAGIAGTVLTAEGETALGAVVELQRIRGDGDRPASGEDAPVQTCDHDGAYAFGGLAPGLWRVVARDGDAAPDVAEVRVEEGENLVVRDLTVGGGGAISGRVEDSRGRRLDGAALELDPFADGFEARTFTTRADGTFREDGLRAGLYRLTLVSKAGAYTGAEALVEVTDGETTAVDLTGSGRAEIEGRVRRHGMPVADAVVRLVALGEGLEEPLRVLETTTDAAGTFAWRDLPAGGYAVDLLDGIVGTRRRLWLADSDRLVLDLVAYEGRIEGRVISPSGRGVGGAWVRARATPGALADVLASRARTRPDGRFVFAGLPPGTYDLYASSPGLPPGRWRGAIADVGAAVEEVEIPLGVGGTLALHVVDRDGKGVPEARVWLETEEGRSLTRQPYAPTGSGRLRLAGVPPGRWWVRVEASGYGTPPRSAVAVHEQTTTPLEVVLPRPARLVVTVRSQAGVVPPARVDLVRESDGSYAARQETVRAEGLWNLAGRVPRGGVLRIEDLGPGAYRLRVSAGARYETVEVPVALVVGESARVEVVLPFAAR